MRCEIPYPCTGPSATIFRISMSSVPCSRSDRSTATRLLLDTLHVYTAAYVECQGESGLQTGSHARDHAILFVAKNEHQAIGERNARAGHDVFVSPFQLFRQDRKSTRLNSSHSSISYA